MSTTRKKSPAKQRKKSPKRQRNNSPAKERKKSPGRKISGESSATLARKKPCSPRQIERKKTGSKLLKKLSYPSLKNHLETYFSDNSVAFFMPASFFNPNNIFFGRMENSEFFQFVLPLRTMIKAFANASGKKKYDIYPVNAEDFGKSLGLPLSNFQYAIRNKTLHHLITCNVHSLKDDLCVRMPMHEDPGAWKCSDGTWDEQCFAFGGFTSGNLPELVVVNLPYTKCRIAASFTFF